MRWFVKTPGIVAAAMLMVVPSFAAQRLWIGPRVVSRPVIVRGYAPVIVSPYGFYGPGWYGYRGPGWYYFRPAYSVGPATGEVKFDTHLKDASVYVDGGYVGPIDKFRKFHLVPGNHDIELRDRAGGMILKERVQVILDKTVEIRPPA
jgi:hypothetical protein